MRADPHETGPDAAAGLYESAELLESGYDKGAWIYGYANGNFP